MWLVAEAVTSLPAAIRLEQTRNCKIAVKQKTNVNTLRTGDADLRFYVTTVRDG